MPASLFDKKFNIGLTLNTSLKAYKGFLDRNGRYIHSVYFSPPLGYKYHTRTIIACQLLLPGKKKLLWDMLELTASYGIQTEMVLNTLCLDDGLVERAAAALSKRGINIQSVATLKAYYPAVTKFFPGKKYIWSFNNGLRTEKDIRGAAQNIGVKAFVLGSNFIRDNELFARIKQSGREVYLLLNNGCSFNCGTCNNTSATCSLTFEKNLQKHSVEYLYALQSIFPCEVHSGVIQAQNIQCFKISNRSSNLAFTEGAINSYVSGDMRKYIQKDCKNYAFWGRAGYFWKYFPKMDFDRIAEYKQQILGRQFDIR